MDKNDTMLAAASGRGSTRARDLQLELDLSSDAGRRDGEPGTSRPEGGVLQQRKLDAQARVILRRLASRGIRKEHWFTMTLGTIDNIAELILREVNRAADKAHARRRRNKRSR